MGRIDYLAMRGAEETAAISLATDFTELTAAANKLLNHAAKLCGTSFLKWLASFAAIYLLILDRTNWRTNMLTSLLIPYIFLSLPKLLFRFLRGEVGKWIAFVAVVLRLFFPRHFPEWLEMPGSLILLLVVSPDLFAHNLRDEWIGVAICLGIGCYLLQEHIRASGGFRNSFMQKHGISNTVRGGANEGCVGGGSSGVDEQGEGRVQGGGGGGGVETQEGFKSNAKVYDLGDRFSQGTINLLVDAIVEIANVIVQANGMLIRNKSASCNSWSAYMSLILKLNLRLSLTSLCLHSHMYLRLLFKKSTNV
ncbi:cold-regulated 413-plasma membrane 2 [Perilla frutescens var. hirtella]|uniref:Cold-regulated 413-plasma membrane 2 n=1 Tax=Perilla frutescens var. hirtella TaxID=608512 RepID=A0AAD4JFS2_PERFH|nr:cold-regulated 413-plasma membrane 2 [Perilla frutescens var. hirtella]